MEVYVTDRRIARRFARRANRYCRGAVEEMGARESLEQNGYTSGLPGTPDPMTTRQATTRLSIASGEMTKASVPAVTGDARTDDGQDALDASRTD